MIGLDPYEWFDPHAERAGRAHKTATAAAMHAVARAAEDRAAERQVATLRRANGHWTRDAMMHGQEHHVWSMVRITLEPLL